MANAMKGETEIQVDGESLRLVFDWEAWAEIEDRFAMPFRSFGDLLEGGLPMARLPEVRGSRRGTCSRS